MQIQAIEMYKVDTYPEDAAVNRNSRREGLFEKRGEVELSVKWWWSW